MTYLYTRNVSDRIKGSGSSLEWYAEIAGPLLPILSKTWEGDQEADGCRQK
jgi:hypothetical protein